MFLLKQEGFSVFALAKKILILCNTQSSSLNSESRKLTNWMSMCMNPYGSPYQLTTQNHIQPKALLILALRVQINVPSAMELKGLAVKILAINDRHNEKGLYSMSSKKMHRSV